MYLHESGYEVYSITEVFATYFRNFACYPVQEFLFDLLVGEILRTEMTDQKRLFFETLKKERRFIVESRADLYDIEDDFKAAYDSFSVHAFHAILSYMCDCGIVITAEATDSGVNNPVVDILLKVGRRP